MATYNVTSATTRGSVYVNGTPVPSPSPTWLDEARDNLNSIGPSPVVNNDFDNAVEASWVTLVAPNPSPPPGTPGSYQAVCSRYFAAFSTASVPSPALSIQLYVHFRTNAENELRIVKASAPSTTAGVTGGNYKAIPGLTNGTGMGGLVTDYTGPLPSPPLGWNAIQLNANAVNDFNSQPVLQLAIVDSAYDYGYVEVPPFTVQRTGISAGTSGPYLLVETGLGQWVLSINPSLAAKVNPVSQANIKLVNRVAQLNFGTAASGLITVVQLQPDGKILVGGDFTTFNGGAANRIVRLNADGSVDTSFNPGGAGFNSFPNDIQVQSDGKILIVGSFSTYNGATVNGIVRLTSLGALDGTFASGTGFTTGSYPTRLKILNTGSYLVIGGFTNYNGATANRIVCILPSGVVDSTVVTGAGIVGTPLTIEIQPADNRILIGGLMSSYNGSACGTMIRLLTNGTLDTSLVTGTGFNNSVRTIAVQSDGSILAHGLFSTYNGVACKTIAKLSNTGTLDTAYASAITRAFGLNGVYGPSGGSTPQVTNLHPLANGQVIATGWFNQWDGTLGSFPSNIPISAIKLNTNGTRDSSFTPEFGSLIRDSVMTPDENIIAGGDFSMWGATTVNYIVRINSNGIKNSLP
jgi:uncharacterized delta-60 repeat protein